MHHSHMRRSLTPHKLLEVTLSQKIRKWRPSITKEGVDSTAAAAEEVVAEEVSEEAGKIEEISTPETMVAVKVLGVVEAVVAVSPGLHTQPAIPDTRAQDIQTYPRLNHVKNILFGASLLTCALSLLHALGPTTWLQGQPNEGLTSPVNLNQEQRIFIVYYTTKNITLTR